MNLFDNLTGNILPYDGTVVYYGSIMDLVTADHYQDALLHSIEWKHDEAVIFGRQITTARMAAWYGDDRYSYTYSGITRHALPWTTELLEIKHRVEQLTGTVFNSCLLNLYHDGNEGMAWHSDDEKELGKNTMIASVSLGAERKFSLKHKRTGATVALVLAHGSLLVMKDETQTHWLHSLPKSKKITRPRINMTFRTIVR